MATKETKVMVTGNSSKYERAMRGVQSRNKRVTDTLKKHWVTFSVAAVAAVMALRKGVTAMITAVKEWVNLSKVQELAEINLAAALRASGEYTANLNMQYQEFASNIQNVTKYGDEQVLTLMALMKNLGVTTDKLEEAAKMTIGLATATGRGADSMGMYVALAMQGEFTMLRRYIPALRSTTDATEQLKIITDFAARGFKVAQEQTESFAIGLEQIKNLYGDLREKLGDFITKNELVIDLMKRTKEWLIELNEQLLYWYENNEALINQKTHEAIDAIATAIRNVVAGLKVLYKLKDVIGEIFLRMPGIQELQLLYKAISKFTEVKEPGWRVSVGRRKRPEVAATAPETKLPALPAALISALEAENKIIEDAMQKQWEMRQTAKQKELTLLSDTLAAENEIIIEGLISQEEIQIEMKEAARVREHEALAAAIDVENSYIEQGLQQQWQTHQAFEKLKMVSAKRAGMMMLANWAYVFKELGQKNRQAFEAFKAISIAETLINTYAAAMGAYKAMVSIPYIGPALAVAAAAAAIAAGMARVSQISAMSPGGSGGAAGGGGATPVYQASPTTGLPPITETEKKGATINIYVENFVGEDSYIDDFVEKITGRVQTADVNLIATSVKG